MIKWILILLVVAAVASLLGFSMEQLVVDNDIIGASLRTIRGIEVTEASLSFETMRQVCIEGQAVHAAAFAPHCAEVGAL